MDDNDLVFDVLKGLETKKYVFKGKMNGISTIFTLNPQMLNLNV